MPGTYPYASATSTVTVAGGTAGLAANRGHAATLPTAHNPTNNLTPAYEIRPVESREESQEVWRIFS